MLRRADSTVSLDTIDPDAPYHDDLRSDLETHGATTVRSGIDVSSSLCPRCQCFDVQSFHRSTTRRKGFLLKDVELGAQTGCKFCGLLLDAVKDVEPPGYFYTHSVVPGKTITNPDIYVHLTISESYKDGKLGSKWAGLRTNRLMVELGDRYSDLRTRSEQEICLAASPRKSPSASHMPLNSDCHD